jgi:hypothetical protein
MTFTVQSLADGQLAASKGTIYTAPTGKQVIVKTIVLVNASAAARTVNLYVKPGSTSRRIIPKDMTLAAGNSLEFDNELTISDGDLIEGDADAATSVDYSIHGVEKTP